MDEKLTDVFERWLQGRINTCVMGLIDRIERLEAARASTLTSNDLEEKISELVRTEVEDAVNSALDDNVPDMVKSALDDNMPDMVMSAIEDAELVSHSDMYDFIRDNVRVELDVSRG